MTREELIAAVKAKREREALIEQVKQKRAGEETSLAQAEMNPAIGQAAGEYAPDLMKYGHTALDLVGRGLDYLGGLARTGLADVLSPADAVTLADYGKALKGEAPPSSEYLRRAGVPEGRRASDVAPGLYSETGNEWLKMKRGGMLDPNAREAAGLALDIASDPLTYIPFTAPESIAGKVAKGASKPIGETLERTGTKLFKTPFTRIDANQVKYGKQPWSQFLLEKQPKGAGLVKKPKGGSFQAQSSWVDKALSDVEVRRGQILQQVGDKALGSPQKAMKPAVDAVAKFRDSNPNLWSSPEFVPERRRAIKRIQNFMEMEPTTARELTTMKTRIGQDISRSARQGGYSDFEEKVLLAMEKGLREEAEKTASAVDKNLGKSLKETNSAWGQLITVEPKITQAATTEAARAPISRSDLWWLSGPGAVTAYTHDPKYLGLSLLGGAAVKGLNSARGATRVGRLLRNTGRASPYVLDPAARRYFINESKDTPWSLLRLK